jgi:hypothetical protein
VCSGAAVVAVIAMCRAVGRRSRHLGTIMVAGLALRLALGLVLFSISYFELPVLADMQLGDGYWRIAPDARRYVFRAQRAAEEGLDTIRGGSASPAYVAILALWTRVVAPGPLGGMFLNLVLYAVLCLIIVLTWRPQGDWRRDLPAIVLLASLSLTPGVVFHSTQVLKDDLFMLLAAFCAVGVLLMLRAVHAESRERLLPGTLGLVLLLTGLYFAAGIRTYYAVIVWGVLMATMLLFAWRGSAVRTARALVAAVVVAALAGAAVRTGAGAYASFIDAVTAASAGRDPEGGFSLQRLWIRARAAVAASTGIVAEAREGFVRTGGATNVAARAPGESPDTATATSDAPAMPVESPEADPGPSPPALVDRPSGPGTHLGRVLLGLALLFVPISALQATSAVAIPGGRGLLVFTDLDTLFIDATVVAGLVLLYRRWDMARAQRAYVCFLLVLSGTLAVLMAYVVTNFGTLVRLRMMAIVPLWLVALAASCRFTDEAGKADSRASPAGPARSTG